MAYRVYLLSSMVLVVSLSPAQNTRVDWYSMNSGSITALSSSLQVTSTIGQALVGTSRQGNSLVAAGFLTYQQLQSGSTSVPDDASLPTTFALYQNYPNPFNPATVIRFSIPAVWTGHAVSLRVYNVLGQEVATLVNEELEPGNYEVTWSPTSMPSGVYIYRIVAGDFVGVRRLVLLK